MMLKVFLFIICTLLIIIVLKVFNSSISKPVALFSGVTIAVIGLNYLNPVVQFITSLSDRVDFNNEYLEIILKSTAICFLGNFASQLCKDSGESTLAYSAEFVCRCTIVSLTLPIYIDVFNWILKLWENV